MLEIGHKYAKQELTQILGTRNKQGIDRKLSRYGIVYEVCGHGAQTTYTIKRMADPFKVFAITELGFAANTDFTKLRNFYYHFFEDEIFMAMPDEVKEVRMWEMGQNLSRQTILKRINTIYSAIAEKKQLSFCYMYYRPDRDHSAKVSKHVFTVNPKQLLWREGVLYMETYANGPIRYPGIEVAEMRNVKKLNTPCIATSDPEIEENLEMFRQLDIEAKESVKTVTVRFHNIATGGVLDMFGQNTLLIPYDKNHFIVNVKADLGGSFYGSIAMFGWMAKIIAPDEALNGFYEYLNGMTDLYNDDIEPEIANLPFSISYENFMNQED